MNSVKLNSFNKLRTLMNLRLVQSPISGGRVISTPSESTFQSRFFTSASCPYFHLRPPHSPCRYEVATPVNWGIVIVPDKVVFVVERFGNYRKTLTTGFHMLIPIVDRIAYVHSLKKERIHIRDQFAVTKNKVHLVIDGVLYVKVVDPLLASYEIVNPLYGISQIARVAVRSEVGKIALEKIFEDTLKEKIVIAINEVAKDWGLKCLCYEMTYLTIERNIFLLRGVFQKLTKMKIHLAQLVMKVSRLLNLLRSKALRRITT